MHLKVAIYTRVSTEDQAKEGFSLDAQSRRLTAYCRSRGWEPIGIYVDEGHSGRTVKRPAYTEMMENMEKWDGLLVMKMDRIHRNSVNFTMMMNTLRKNEKEFISMQEKFDTTNAMGRFVMDIVQRIAQLESEQIGERVRTGMEQKARTGTGHLGSGHPYGYVYDDGELKVIENEASVVKEIFRLRSCGYPMNRIASILNGNSIKAKKGGQWNRQSVHRILNNPIYTGQMRWDGIQRDGEHTAIISHEEYENANTLT